MSEFPVLSNVDRIVREPERRALTGLGRVQWWRLERQDKAPKGFRITARSKGWRLSELLAFNDARAREGPAIVDYPETERCRPRKRRVEPDAAWNAADAETRTRFVVEKAEEIAAARPRPKRGWPKGKPRGRGSRRPRHEPARGRSGHDCRC